MISLRRLGDPLERGGSLTLTIDGQSVTAHAGESVASVLLVEGFSVLRRSVRFAAPRSLFCGMGVCFECLVTVDGRPNLRACVTPVAEGMRVETGRVRR